MDEAAKTISLDRTSIGRAQAVTPKKKETVITMKQKILTFFRDERGLTTVEYAVAGGLIALVVITAFTNLGTTVGGVITQIDALLP